MTMINILLQMLTCQDFRSRVLLVPSLLTVIVVCSCKSPLRSLPEVKCVVSHVRCSMVRDSPLAFACRLHVMHLVRTTGTQTLYSLCWAPQFDIVWFAELDPAA
jgi:hypothetical protein